MKISSAFCPPLACLATLGPLGHLRPAPGTIGSAIAVFSGYFLASHGAGLLAAATLLVTVIGVFAADAYSQQTGRKDAAEVIIDEVAGQWLPLIILPLDPWWFAAAFILFRFFDITKIGPVGMAESLAGGVGVMADDIIAGLLAAICLWSAGLMLGEFAI